VDILSQTRYPASIPSVGHGRGVLAWFRNVTGYITQHHHWVQDGYIKHSKHERAFLLPSSASRPADIVLPRTQTAWLLDQPESVVSAGDAHNHIMHSQYNFLGARLAEDGLHVRVVHRHLARHLPALIPDIAEEVRESVDDAFTRGKGQKPNAKQGAGTLDDGWMELNLWDAFIHVVPRVTNRVMVGHPLCRDESFLESMVAVADVSVRNCFILAMVPSLFHPIVARLITIPNQRHWRTAHRAVRPLIEARLRDMLSEKKADYKPPEDFITWSIRQAMSENSAFDLEAETISKRLVPVEFAAIHTTVLTLHSLILDILSSPNWKETIAAIVDEVQGALAATPDNGWTKSSLLSLYRTDSAVRESQRLSNFHSTLVERLVVSPNGLHNPIEGWTAPQGSWITFNLTGMHHDEDLYENAQTYDAFRFSRVREALEKQAAENQDENATMEIKRLGMVTTSDSHLAFGHGRHACPGRFFVAHEIKMILAHLFMNYDVQKIEKRPQPMWIGATIVPPLDATINVRRKA
jgi:cytochrome P450